MTQQIIDSKIINLQDYRTPKSKVFTGRDRGERVRLDSNIDLLADENEIIKIIIPDNLYSINPSFFEEFLINVVRKYRKEGFLKKFIFENTGDYNYLKPLNEAIDRILRANIALYK